MFSENTKRQFLKMFFLLFLVTQTSKKLSLNILNKHSVNITGIIFVHKFEAPFTLVHFRFKRITFMRFLDGYAYRLHYSGVSEVENGDFLKKLPTPYQFETFGVVFQV